MITNFDYLINLLGVYNIIIEYHIIYIYIYIYNIYIYIIYIYIYIYILYARRTGDSVCSGIMILTTY